MTEEKPRSVPGSTDKLPLIQHDDDLFSPQGPSSRWEDCGRRWRGIILAILSAFLFSCQALLVAKIQNVHFMEITFFRMLIQTLYITPMVYFKKQSFFGERDDWVKLFFRGVFGTVSMGCMYFAVQRMPLGEASVIRFSAPVFVGLMACILLKEPCGVFEVSITIAALLGVTLIAQPPFIFPPMLTTAASMYAINETSLYPDYDLNITNGNSTEDADLVISLRNRLFGSFTALMAAMAGACVHVIVRQLRHLNVSTVIFTYSVLGTILSALTTFIIGHWSFHADPVVWIELFGIGTFAVLAQLCFTAALKVENAGTVSVLRTTEILFAFLWQTMLLELFPNVYSIVGACLITLGAVSHGVRKWYTTRYLDLFEEMDSEASEPHQQSQYAETK